MKKNQLKELLKHIINEVDNLKESMTTRTDLDKKIMKAVNVEAIGPTGKKINIDTVINTKFGKVSIWNLMKVARKYSDKRTSKLHAFSLNGIVIPGLYNEILYLINYGNIKNLNDKAFLQAIGSLEDDSLQKNINENVSNFERKIKQRLSSINESGDNKIYKDRQGGQDVYWIDNTDMGGKIFIKPEVVNKYIRKGYRIIDLKNADINEMTSTGSVAGYSTPFAFSKNKEGSPRAISAAKKYGKVVKSISKEEE